MGVGAIISLGSGPASIQSFGNQILLGGGRATGGWTYTSKSISNDGSYGYLSGINLGGIASINSDSVGLPLMFGVSQSMSVNHTPLG